jgi:hypothetical protein
MKSDNHASGSRYFSREHLSEPKTQSHAAHWGEKQTEIFMAALLVLWILKETLTMPLWSNFP